MQKRVFRHIHARQTTQYTFFQVPYDLIRDEYYKTLSDGSRLLYGRMLDRTGLSIKNHWIDEDDNSYIVYTIEEIHNDFGWCREKIAKCLSELEKIGLIERKRCGMGRPNRIYVNNFFEYDEEKSDTDLGENESKKGRDKAEPEDKVKSSLETENQEVRESESMKSENRKSRSSETGNQEVRKSKIKKFENRNSGSSEPESQEVRKSNPSQEIQSQPDTVQSIYPSSLEESIERAREQIEYDIIAIDESNGALSPFALHVADMAVDTISRIMLMGNDRTVKISGVNYPAITVKKRMLQINREHILYIENCMRNVEQPVKNIQSYFLTALFNAPASISTHYDISVQTNR